MLHQNSSKDNEESTLLRTGLSGAIIRLSIIFKLKPSLSLEKRFTSLWKKVKTDNNRPAAIQKHLVCRNYSLSFNDFSVLTRESNEFKLKIKDGQLISCDKPVLKHSQALFLELFLYNISGCHLISYHPIVRMQLLFVQFSILCYEF